MYENANSEPFFKSCTISAENKGNEKRRKIYGCSAEYLQGKKYSEQPEQLEFQDHTAKTNKQQGGLWCFLSLQANEMFSSRDWNSEQIRMGSIKRFLEEASCARPIFSCRMQVLQKQHFHRVKTFIFLIYFDALAPKE